MASPPPSNNTPANNTSTRRTSTDSTLRSTASANNDNNHLTTEDATLGLDSDAISRSRSTRRLREFQLNNTGLANSIAAHSATPQDAEELIKIVAQHLAVVPTNDSEDHTLSTLPSNASTKSSIDVSTIANSVLPSKKGSSINSLDPVNTTNDFDGPVLNAPSHLQLEGGDLTHDLYKWHKQETRRQLGPRTHTFHGIPSQSAQGESILDSGESEVAQIKAPGGFRRHYIATANQEDSVDGQSVKKEHHTKSFVHFLAAVNIYGIDHFAGENFHSVPPPNHRSKSYVSLRSSSGHGQGSRNPSRRNSVHFTTPSVTGSKYSDEGSDYEQGDERIVVEEEKISFGKAVGMLFKSFIASGILFVPNAFLNGGALFSPLFMILIAALCLHSFLLLVKCREQFPGSYGDIGGHFYGKWMRGAVLFSIVISQFGFCCGYAIFVAQQLAIVVEALGGAALDKGIWIIIFFLLLVPFTMIRNISRFSYSALIADICIIIGLVYLYVYDVKEIIQNGGPPAPLPLFNTADFGLFIGTAVFSYEGIGMVIPICSSMKNPKEFPKALTIVLSTVCVLLVSFGSMGYAAYGSATQVIILDNLPMATSGEKTGKSVVQILYCIAIILTTPLMLFPCIRIIEQAIFKDLLGTVLPKKEARKRMMYENIVRLLIDLAVAVVAYVAFDMLGLLISFIGSFACAPLLFVFPPLFHLRAFPEQSNRHKVSNYILILFGALVFAYTLVVTIQGFSTSA